MTDILSAYSKACKFSKQTGFVTTYQIKLMFVWKPSKIFVAHHLSVSIFDLNFVFNLVYFFVCSVFVNSGPGFSQRGK